MTCMARSFIQSLPEAAKDMPAAIAALGREQYVEFIDDSSAYFEPGQGWKVHMPHKG